VFRVFGRIVPIVVLEPLFDLLIFRSIFSQTSIDTKKFVRRV